MALADVLDGLRGLIPGAPSYAPGIPFRRRPLEDRGDIAELCASQSRAFEVVAVGLSEGPNITGGTMAYGSADVEVRVAYSLHDSPEVQGTLLMAASDLKDIVNAIRPPAAWHAFAFEISPDANAARIETVTDGEGGTLGHLLVLPVRAEWEN